MKNIVKNIIYIILLVTGINLLIKYFNRRKVVILMYHGLVDQENIHEWTQMHIEKFVNQMEYLANHYSPVSLDDAIKYLDDKIKLPPNPVVVTFDDGYQSNYTLGQPILEKYNIPATVYLATSVINSGNNEPKLLWFDYIYALTNSFAGKSLDLSEYDLGQHELETPDDRYRAGESICEMLKKFDNKRIDEILSTIKSEFPLESSSVSDYSGATNEQINNASPLMTVGAHTVNHSILTKISLAEAEDEIVKSNDDIMNITGKKTENFAFPNGSAEDYSKEIIIILRKNGFKSAVTTIEGVNNIGDDHFQLKRIGIGCDNTMLWFKLAVSGTINLLKTN